MLPDVLPVAVVGCGTMGRLYIDLLRQIYPAQQIIAMDRDPQVRATIAKMHAEITVCDTLEEVASHRPQMVFNLVNSPEHLSVFRWAAEANVDHVFCEKPVVLASQLEELGEIAAFQSVAVGYVLNFSEVMPELFRVMDQGGLRVFEARCWYGKNRSEDKRATAGDLEDELTHAHGVIMAAIMHNQRVKSQEIVSAHLTRLPFVSEEKQRSAHERDSSYPLEPVSSSLVAAIVETDALSVPVHLQSSFVMFSQERRVQFVFTRDGLSIAAMAEISFDTPTGDGFAFRLCGGGTEQKIQLPSKTKLRNQLKAYLAYAEGRLADSRLVSLPTAIKYARFSEAVLEVAKTGQRISI